MGSWVPCGTFLVKYGTFVRYVPIVIMYFLGPKSAHFLAKISSLTMFPTT